MHPTSSPQPPIEPGVGIVRGPVRRLLRLEGAAVLAASVIGYHGTGASGWLFGALFLVPDLSFAAFVVGKRAGAWAYNLVHTYVLPVALLAVSARWAGILPYALIWTAHIGWDRLVGYGLKYETGFGDTHLGRMGGPKARAA